ncbi:hypothetical protein C0Q70_06740 [Pomacea canaliculata]|uniref:Uncharacterized protein n=1 Tax=Pomacea canaliculata TaxID=400727 RepID=A0A2T7PD37_POMCA|nr:hypothetical protein C0Q70_06740 [Pomacea canaliculata]
MSFFHSVKLVVVDSVASVFHPVLGGKQMDSLALLEQLGLQLKQLAVDFCLAVLVSNNMTSGFEGKKQPSLGRLWSHVPHTRIILERETNSLTKTSHRKAVLVKSMRQVGTS